MRYEPPALLSDYTEAQWQRVVQEAALVCGFTFQYHTHDSRKSAEGFPDLVLVDPNEGRTVYLELKLDKASSKPTPMQVEWVRALRKTGVHAWIVRPRNVDLMLAILGGRIDPPEVGTGAYLPTLQLLADNELKTAAPRRKGSRYIRSRS